MTHTCTALFNKHRKQPGKRDEMRQIRQRHVNLRMEVTAAHLFYIFL